MSVKFTYLLHWLGARWPYVVATALALFFVVLKGFPLLRGDADDIASYDPERKRLLAKTAQQVAGKIGHNWFLIAGIAAACVWFLTMLVFLFDR